MTARAAIIAGRGDLPGLLAKPLDNPFFVTLTGEEVTVPEGVETFEADIARIGALFQAMKERNVTHVVFAGATSRPKLDPSQFDEVMRGFAPRLIPALQKGDDALLREVLGLFEEHGFEIVAPPELVPELCLSEGEMLGRDMTRDEALDAARGHAILSHCGHMDLGQACVVAAGLCLGIETLQGTDAMLRFVGETPDHLRRAPGVLVKAPKPGQDMRVDMPVIGPETISAAHAAGLAGIVIQAEGVMVLHRDRVEELLEETGLFLAAL